MHLPSKFRRKVYDNSVVSELMMNVIRGRETAEVAVNAIIRHFSFDLPQLNSEVSSSILENCVVEAFANSNPASSSYKEKSSIGLGPLAESLVVAITGMEDRAPWAVLMELPPKIPHLACYGQIEQSYMDISRQALKISQSGGE